MLITNTRRNGYAPRPKLATYAAARRFHETVLQWAVNAQDGRSPVSLLERRMHDAVSAIRVAVDSPAYQRHLFRAKEHLLICLAEFELIADEGQFPDELCREAMARVDQILRGVDELAATPIDRWKDLELPLLIPVEPEDEVERHAREMAVEQAADVDRLFAQRLRPVIKKPVQSPVAPSKPAPNKEPPSKEAPAKAAPGANGKHRGAS